MEWCDNVLHLYDPGAVTMGTVTITDEPLPLEGLLAIVEASKWSWLMVSGPGSRPAGRLWTEP